MENGESFEVRSKIILFLRFIIVGLVIFEIINSMRILHFTLDFSWLGLIITGLAAWAIGESIIHFRKDIDPVIVLLLIAVMLYLDSAGDIAHLYTHIRFYDKFLHFFNSALVGYLGFLLLFKRLHYAGFGIALSFVIIAGISITLGTLYELEEFSEDLFINNRQLRFGDAIDTGTDLLMNVTGNIVSICFILVFKFSSLFKSEKSIEAQAIPEQIRQ